MRKLLLTLVMLASCFVASAKEDIDFSSRFQEGTNTIVAESAWGWYNVILMDYDLKDYEYCYIQYESSCDFNFIIQDGDWHNAYSTTCRANAKEGYLKLTPGAYDKYSCVVIQNTSAGEITIKKAYFCTEDEYFNPKPDNLEDARANLIDMYARYEAIFPNFVGGTTYGCYPQELIDALDAALNAALVMDDPAQNYGQDLTVEQLNALSQAIVDAYRKLAASEIRFVPASGYYRIVAARQYGYDNEGEWVPVTKGLYSTSAGTNGWTTLKRDDGTFLWTLEAQEDKTVIIKNAANGLYLSTTDACTDRAANFYIDALDPATEYAYELSTDNPDAIIFNFRLSTDEGGAYNYFHQNGHNSGTGNEGNIVKWCNTSNESGGSEWWLEPVSDEDVKMLLDATSVVNNFYSLLADAQDKAEKAYDRTKTVLVEEAAQFSSPFSHNDLSDGRDGGDLSEGVLLDGSGSTFWHSYWGGGNADNGTHYLQVELPDEISGEILMDVMRRANIDSDQITKWGVYGNTVPSGEKLDWEWITDIETPYDKAQMHFQTTFEIPEELSSSYLRFYAETTTSNRGYFHLGDFQLYSLSDNPNNQAGKLGDLYTNLLDAIEVAKAVNKDNVKLSDYNALKEVYDAFMEKFVDPTPLREALPVARRATDFFVEGDRVGEWESDEVKVAIEKLIEEAEAYDQAGEYTKEQSDNYAQQLAAARQTLLDAANKIDPSKWYAIGFASEDMYEEYGWSTSNAAESDFGPLYDTWMHPGTVTDDNVLVSLTPDKVRRWTSLRFSNEANADIAFRFVAVGDTAYAIQHKATGLFIQCHGYNSWTELNAVPTLFTVEPIGYGENLIRAKNLDGKDYSNLHAQLRDHLLVTWEANTAGSNSGLIIEEAKVKDEIVGTPLFDITNGAVGTYCLPIAITPAEGHLFKAAGTYEADGKRYVAFNRAESAAPGEPVIYVNGDVTAYDSTAVDNVKAVAFAFGTEIAKQPIDGGALKGVYEDTAMEEGNIIFRHNAAVSATAEDKAYANTAYAVMGAQEADASAHYDLILEVDGGATNAIQSAIATLNQRANIYNAAGMLIRRNASFNDLQQLGRGVYIFQGRKVILN